jgi:hypothetical protein
MTYETAIHARLREICESNYDVDQYNSASPDPESWSDMATQILEEFDVLYKAEWTKSSRLGAEMRYR